VAAQRGAGGRTVAGQHLQHTGREAGLNEQLGEAQDRQRRLDRAWCWRDDVTKKKKRRKNPNLLGGLQDHDVAARQRGTKLPGSLTTNRNEYTTSQAARTHHIKGAP
jgi:hypothetical protein